MKVAKRVFLLISLFLGSSVISLAQETTTRYEGKISSVHDGNTLTLSADNKKLRIRLLGIEVPKQALEDDSRENLKRLLDKKSIVFLAAPLEISEGKQKLLVGKVLLNDSDVALTQIEDGFAWQSYDGEKYLNQADRKLYSAAEQRAKDSKRGVWSDDFKPCKNAAVKTSVGAAKLEGENVKGPKVFGTVVVEVIIDESGDVISARPLCGHPILQTEAVKAAFKAKFKGQSFRVQGTINYNFVPEEYAN